MMELHIPVVFMSKLGGIIGTPTKKAFGIQKAKAAFNFK